MGQGEENHPRKKELQKHDGKQGKGTLGEDSHFLWSLQPTVPHRLSLRGHACFYLTRLTAITLL